MRFFDWIFNDTLGHIAVAFVGLIALIGSFWAHNANQRAIGAATAHVATEKQNAAVTKRASSAAAKSADPATRGVLNPNYRAD